MTTGWIRAYGQELQQFGYSDANTDTRNRRAEFRRDFRTTLRATASDTGDPVRELRWGDVVELPTGIDSDPFTAVEVGSDSGFVPTSHLVEIAFVCADPNLEHGYETNLTYRRGSGPEAETVEIGLIWGDCVQILRRDGDTCHVRARGSFGSVAASRLTAQGLMEVFFIDVGQGDGILVRTPDHRHILVDGGLERMKQQTGKNAADFTDWKFFTDYGDFAVRLDSMVASHSDSDHYGGLHDLVRTTNAADRELDCVTTTVGTFCHPGLSRWERRTGVSPAHHDGLGPRALGEPYHWFVRLLGDRTDAVAATGNGALDELGAPWKHLVRDVLRNSEATAVQRLGVRRETLEQGGLLPRLWDDTDGYDIRVLAPVTVDRDGSPALPDLGPKSYNTNGHSVCLRLDYGAASIVLTGDLNKESHDWLMASYGDRMGAWLCDVAKACHHGSHKISYRFLETMHAAATVISSGDAEGYSHPRPEIVAASATAGRIEVDRSSDVLITPLVYMTEIERSVTLGALDRIDFEDVPVGDAGATVTGSVLGRHFDELNDQALLTPDEEAQIDAAPELDQSSLRIALRAAARERLRDQQARFAAHTMQAKFAITVPQGPVGSKFQRRSIWRSRIMDKNHYGLVNVRTDGRTIFCATMDETEKGWIIHTFPARTRSQA